MKKSSSKETNSTTYKEAMCSKKYRRTTCITFVLTVSTLPNGVFMITSLGGIIFRLIYDVEG